MDNKKCLIFIKGFDPIYDDKYHTAEKEEYKLAMKLGPYEHKKRQWLQQYSLELQQRYEENEAVLQENRQLKEALGGKEKTNVNTGSEKTASDRKVLIDEKGGKQTLVRQLQEVRLNEEQTEIIDHAIGKGMGEEQLLILLRDGWTTDEMRKLCAMFLQEAHG